MSEYVVIYEQAKDGTWGAFILPGVVALGTTRSEVTERHPGGPLSVRRRSTRSRALVPVPPHATGVVAA